MDPHTIATCFVLRKQDRRGKNVRSGKRGGFDAKFPHRLYMLINLGGQLKCFRRFVRSAGLGVCSTFPYKNAIFNGQS